MSNKSYYKRKQEKNTEKVMLDKMDIEEKAKYNELQEQKQQEKLFKKLFVKVKKKVNRRPCYLLMDLSNAV